MCLRYRGRVTRQTTCVRMTRAGARLALAMSLSVIGCSAGADWAGAPSDVASSRAKAAVAPGWKEVSYRGTTFDVPSEWPVSTAGSYESSCLTYGRPGVFLASGDPQGEWCPRTDYYAATLHIAPLRVSQPSERAEVVSSGAAEMWVQGTDANLWLEAAFPARGVVLTFYEVDPAVRAAVLASVA
jgi:hypothetical protein